MEAETLEAIKKATTRTLKTPRKKTKGNKIIFDEYLKEKNSQICPRLVRISHCK
jgi:hypothetical protein